MPPRKTAAPATKRKTSAAKKAKAAPKNVQPAGTKLARHIATLAKSHDQREIVEALRQAIVDIDPPSTFSQKIADEICERMSLGETLRQIVRDKHIPTERDIFRWRSARPDFAQSYARARVEQMSAWASEMIALMETIKAQLLREMGVI